MLLATQESFDNLLNLWCLLYTFSNAAGIQYGYKKTYFILCISPYATNICELKTIPDGYIVLKNRYLLIKQNNIKKKIAWLNLGQHKNDINTKT